MLAFPRFLGIFCVVGLASLAGCDGSLAKTNAPSVPAPTPILAATPEVQAINQAVSDIMNDGSRDFKSLDYDYNEDLLRILDVVETHLKNGTAIPDPRPMSHLSPAEEIAHFRETIKRWEVQTGKNLRKTIDPLKADVASRASAAPKRGSSFFPDFQRKFSAAFDDFIPIEVAEIRERRNRWVHAQAKPKLDAAREKAPDAVKEIEAMLAKPPWNLPAESTPKS